MLNKILITALTATSIFSFSAHAEAREQIRAVGSSTVYPFTTIVAEEFGKKTKFNTPIIESTGTGGGFKLFCAGAGDETPDLSNASRAIKSSEKELCEKNGVKDITEVKIGFDGIVLANSIKGKPFTLTKEQIFKALARKVAVNGKLVDNPYQKWSDIDKSLPAQSIEVYGPPPTSGTRDAFVELVMDEACKAFPEFKAAYKDEKELQKACQLLREDGKYIEAGENDNLIIQKLSTNHNALGVFGYSFLEENGSVVQGSTINGQAPTFETISGGTYEVSRPLFVYVKNAHFATVPGLKEFVKELASDAAIGADGYLSQRGLIPLPADEAATVRASVEKVIK